MYELTHNNHFKFGYNDGEWYRSRQSPNDRWAIRYGSITRPIGNFGEECRATARLIRDSISGPLTVLFSGGVDSEVVIRSFHEQGIPITAAICQFSDNLNLHDMSFAVVCCEQLSIPYKLVQLDIGRFMESEVFDYAVASQARSSIFCSSWWLADQMDGVPVAGSGDLYIRKEDTWALHEREHQSSWYRHFMRRERNAVARFFQHTPEIMLSLLMQPTIIDLVNGGYPGRQSNMFLKLPIYQQYFPLAARPKYTGYEKLTDRVERADAYLKELFPYSELSMIEYHDLITMLNGHP